ncbi:ATP-binding cassette domain-containing protein [bacterium]|nr:ATP-binding cassette domain-containing protein [bacterium]
MTISITGARENNLKGIDVVFSEGLTAVTGISGSGKTSLVFDTLYHEARRRYLDIFAVTANTARLNAAVVDEIIGLGPAVAVSQNSLNWNPNSTLATASGLHPFFRLLYARLGERKCRACGSKLDQVSEDDIVKYCLDLEPGIEQEHISIYIPLLTDSPGSHTCLLAFLEGAFGPDKIRVDGDVLSTIDRPLEVDKEHDLGILVHDLSVPVKLEEMRAIIRQAREIGSNGLHILSDRHTERFSFTSMCSHCGRWYDTLGPADFNIKCPHCSGSGCPTCSETGLTVGAASVSFDSYNFNEMLSLSVSEAKKVFNNYHNRASATRLFHEIRRRLEALDRVGLGYLVLSRPSPTLSRGESQRVRLAVILNSQLEDILYILDEPTIGQHPTDVTRFLPVLRQLAGPVVFVEHDRAAVAAADRVIDLGPGAGRSGGQIVFCGSPQQLWQENTLTGRFFSGREDVCYPPVRTTPDVFLSIIGAFRNNLKNIDVRIPLERFTTICGVSGSGKSTLIEEVIVPTLTEKQAVGCRQYEGVKLKPVLVDQKPIGRNPRSNPATYTNLADIIRDMFSRASGLSPAHFSFNRPEGACPVCSGLGSIEVRMKYLASSWVRCASCAGRRFSEEVLSKSVTFGKRSFTIADFFELSVDEVGGLLLESVFLAQTAFEEAKSIITALKDIGLGYMPLGQPSPTLSGGEAQRVKLAKYLGKRNLHRQLIILDEPSTGLHLHDLSGLLAVLDRLVRNGATIIVVEHALDFIRASDWAIELGPGAGPDGGRLLYAGPSSGLEAIENSPTGQALRADTQLRSVSDRQGLRHDHSETIVIRNARTHNLRDLTVTIPKHRLTLITGVSGSGKSSLVKNILETEGKRRFLETLSLYERQGTREGAEAEVDSISGLGVTTSTRPTRRFFEIRSTVGTISEISHNLAILFATIGERLCPECGRTLERHQQWRCPHCHFSESLPGPSHFDPTIYAAACEHCQGVGTIQEPVPDKLIIHPEKPLCAGAMYSPGFFPKGFLCKPFNSGYDIVQAVARKYGFDPMKTPWEQMDHTAQQVFLFGDKKPLEVVFSSKSGRIWRKKITFGGFYSWIRDWDVGGTYTRTIPCPECGGARLRARYRSVTVRGKTMPELGLITLTELGRFLIEFRDHEFTFKPLKQVMVKAIKRLEFLERVGLGYLHLERIASTLSAGEAQRLNLASLLGSGLTSLTVLLDEPTRGLHPSEIEVLLSSLKELRDEGNTVIMVEHDLQSIRAADHIIDFGPGAGQEGGTIVAQGPKESVQQSSSLTGQWLRGERTIALPTNRRKPMSWLTIRGAQANNLKGQTISVPLGVLVGICGVSGSGKSTLCIDTIGRALAPKTHTTSVAHEPIEPGKHDSIEGAPSKTIMVDQARASIVNPANFLGLTKRIHSLYAQCVVAQLLEISEKDLTGPCSVCKGRGVLRHDMGFLPAMHDVCETCQGSGYCPEAWQIEIQGVALPQAFELSLDQLGEFFKEDVSIQRICSLANHCGLGYLVLKQPGYDLSGGEIQRLKIVKELLHKADTGTMYILDEPTVGQHLEDIRTMLNLVNSLVEAGNTVMIIEHQTDVLAGCDWLIEFGPCGGPQGGYVVASGPPEEIAAGTTPTAVFLRKALWRKS